MKKAPIPENEKERLKILQDYKILDTPPCSKFDDLTYLASSICETPIALVSLVDENRQWFKSSYGLDSTETPRDISFCGHAICEKDLFVVNDSLQDPRFFDNPFVTEEPFVRFYAGAQLISPEGAHLGTLCVIDNKPRKLNEIQSNALCVLAHQVMTQLELTRSHSHLSQQFFELKRATETIYEQQALLTHRSQLAELGEVAAGIGHEINNPLAIVAGNANVLIQKLKNEGKISTEHLQKGLEKIVTASFRITGIIKTLKSLSRDGSNDPITSVDLKQAFKDVRSLLHKKLALSRVSISWPSNTSSFALGREPHILQILTNLMGNASDAVSSLDEKWIRIEVKTFNDQIRISVIDSGKGLPDKIAQKIMNPFFTTKAPGEGTGLGLSISLKLAQAQGGKLYLDQSHKNTCFVLELPKAPAKRAVA